MKTTLKKGIAIGLSLVLTAGFAPQIKDTTVYAAGEAEPQETVRCVNVGTAGLKSVPETVPHLEDDATTGGWYLTYSQKVYFGHYDGVDTAYRVLKNDGNRVLLDCDNILYMMTWSEDGLANPEQQSGEVYEWMGSNIQKDLSAKYRNGAFCDEKEKIAVQYSCIPQQEAHKLDSLEINAYSKFYDYAVNDYYFILSASEWVTYYGQINAYCSGYDLGATKMQVDKTLKFASNWLRSKEIANGYTNPFLSCAYNNIRMNSMSTRREGAVSPAFYLDSSKVLLTTLSDKEKASKLEAVTAVKIPPATAPKYGANPVLQGENLNWKLTLKDSAQSIQAGTPARLGNTITLPYTYSGDCANRVSVMITDRAYTDAGAQDRKSVV